MGLPEEKQQKVNANDLDPQQRPTDGPGAADTKQAKEPGLADLAAQVLSGEITLGEAVGQIPALVSFLQATLGNEMVAKLLEGGEEGEKKKRPGDEEAKEQSETESEEDASEGGGDKAAETDGQAKSPNVGGRQALTVLAGGAAAGAAAATANAAGANPDAQAELGDKLKAKEDKAKAKTEAKKKPVRKARKAKAQDPIASPPTTAGGGEVTTAKPQAPGNEENEARELEDETKDTTDKAKSNGGEEKKVGEEVQRTAKEQGKGELKAGPATPAQQTPQTDDKADPNKPADPATDGPMPSDEQVLQEVNGKQDDKGSGVQEEAKKTEDKAGGAGGGEVVPDGPGGQVPGAPGPDAATEGKEDKEGEGGGGGETVPAAPVGEGGEGEVAAVPEGPGGTLDEYMAANPDTAAAESVASQKMVTDKIGRNTNELHGKIDLPPDKSWLDAVTPRQEWFKLTQAVKGNKWSGQDGALAFMTNLNSIVDFISGAAGKIGLAATIGGAILTLLVPPVGAFLLAVGRVMNAVSLACAAVRAISSIVTTVMLAVKAAKEKDPAKRLEMMQEMKANVQAGVMAGIEIVMSKIGGGAKGGAAKAGGKGMNAAKATWKEAGGLKGAMKQGFKEGGVKGALKAGGGLVKDTVKAGAGAAKDGLKQSWKEGVQGLKNTAASMKQLGVGGTLKHGLNTAGGALKDKFIKPLADLPTAFKEFKGSWKTLKTDWSSFKGAVKSDGYFSTIKSMNFPNYGKEGLKGLKKDLLDTTGGGYASRVHMGMNGAPKKEESKLPGGPKDDRTDLQRSIDKQKADLAKLEKAKSGSRADKIKALNGDDMGGAQKALYDKGKADGDLSTRLGAYKNRKGSELDDGSLDVLLDTKIAQTKASQNLLMPKSNGSAAMDLAKSGYDLATGKGDFGDLAKTGLSHMGVGGSTASKFMVNDETSAQKSAKKKSLLKKLQEDNDARTKKAAASVVSDVQGAPQYGVTQGKVQATMSPVLGLFQERTTQLQEAMSATPGGKATDTSTDQGGDAQASALPPPPPAPPEGMTVPDAGLLADISGQRKALSGYKTRVQADIAQAQVYKEQAIGGDAKLAEYAAGLDTQSAEIAKENEAAKKDTADIAKSKEDLATGGKEIAAGAQKAEGEKGKTEAESNKGSGLSVQPDEAKKRAEEEKDARKREADFQREYKNAGYLRKKYLKAKKWLFSFANLLKKAAEWVWKKMIAPAIKAVKAALGKVMNFITNMMMSGILKLVKLFLSKEEANRLDETFAQMKELEAKQAEAATQETADKNAEAKKQLGDARQAAATKIETCQKNVDEGNALIAAIDAHDKTLAGEYAKVDGARKAFIAQYTPYFDWVKLRDSQPPAEDKAGGGGGGKESEGGEKQPHPADRPLSPAVGEALSAACGIVKEDSLAAEKEIAGKSAEQRDKVHKSAWGVYDENRRDIAVAAVGVLAPSVDAVTPLYDHEQGRVKAVQNAADAVHANVTGAIASSESARRGRLEGLAGEAATLSTMAATNGAAKARDLYQKLAAEAKGIDEARSKAYEAMSEGYARAAKSGA